MKRYYFIVGEASGDLHAANLIKELSALDNDATFQGFGGERMQKEGLELTKHYQEMAFMGFWEVLMNLSAIRKNFKQAKKELLEYKPDVLVLVDYPGFNMRMATFAKKHNIKVVYYITPQVWAWKESRVKKLKRDVDLLLPILPFELSFFAKHGIDVSYVGHPLLDALKDLDSRNIESEKPIIAILPGSRKQEIATSLPIMMEVAKSFENYQFIIAGAPSISQDYYRSITQDSYMPVLSNQTHALLKECKAAIVTSGTATLKDAMNEALRDWVSNVTDTFYVIGTVAGPHPYPMMVRDFQSIIGKETKQQIIKAESRLPDLLLACIGGGSNALGLFYPFLNETKVKIIGVEAAGKGINTNKHAASLSKGKPGFLHGNYTYLLQDNDGQITDAHSISAGLDYPGIGPEHSWLKDSGRAEYVAVDDDEALEAFHQVSELEGIIPALETAHAFAYLETLMKEFDDKSNIIVNVSGRGDKDINTVAEIDGIKI